MNKLIIVRHAKSSPGTPGVDDHQRPLNAQGVSDARAMGLRLCERRIVPDLVAASTARRAMETAGLLAQALGYDQARIEPLVNLYTASPSAWLSVIAALSDDVHSVILIGHNPEITDLVNALAPIEVDNMPACALLELAYDTAHWSEVGRREPQYWHLDYPGRVQH